MVQARIIKGEFKNLFSRQFDTDYFFFSRIEAIERTFTSRFTPLLRLNDDTPLVTSARDAFVSVFKRETTHGPLISCRIPILTGLSLEKGKYRVCELASDRI